MRRLANTPKGKIGALDLGTRTARTDYAEKLGSIKDLVVTGADETEKLWGEVEKRLPHAFKLIEERKILDNKEFLDTIKDCVVLHFARSFALAELFNRDHPKYRKQVSDRVLAKIPASQAVHAMTGVWVPESSARPLAQQYIGDAFDAEVHNDGLLAKILVENYHRGRKLAEEKDLEFWYTDKEEFVIGDIPAVVYNKDTDQVGVLNGVAWNDADALVMTLGPHHAVALSKKAAYLDANSRTVEWINVMQVRGAYKEVYYRPGSGLDDLLIDALKQKS